MNDSADLPSSDTSPEGELLMVLKGYRIYLACMVSLWLGCTLLGAWAFFSQLEAEQGGPQMGLAISGMGVFFLLLFGLAFFLPRKPWAWNAHLLLICLGVPGCITAPLALLMIYGWLLPSVRTHFMTP